MLGFQNKTSKMTTLAVILLWASDSAGAQLYSQWLTIETSEGCCHFVEPGPGFCASALFPCLMRGIYFSGFGPHIALTLEAHLELIEGTMGAISWFWVLAVFLLPIFLLWGQQSMAERRLALDTGSCVGILVWPQPQILNVAWRLCCWLHRAVVSLHLVLASSVELNGTCTCWAVILSSCPAVEVALVVNFAFSSESAE